MGLPRWLQVGQDSGLAPSRAERGSTLGAWHRAGTQHCLGKESRCTHDAQLEAEGAEGAGAGEEAEQTAGKRKLHTRQHCFSDAKGASNVSRAGGGQGFRPLPTQKSLPPAPDTRLRPPPGPRPHSHTHRPEAGAHPSCRLGARSQAAPGQCLTCSRSRVWGWEPEHHGHRRPPAGRPHSSSAGDLRPPSAGHWSRARSAGAEGEALAGTQQRAGPRPRPEPGHSTRTCWWRSAAAWLSASCSASLSLSPLRTCGKWGHGTPST